MKINNLNKSSIKYIREIASIPEKYRKSYYEKVLRRKNSTSQKNILFIKYVYDVIKSSKLNSWNDNEICKQMGISYNMLRWYKCKLLKKLRLHYLGEGLNFPKEKEMKSDDAALIRAKLLYSGSFKREAKNILLRLEKMYLMKNRPRTRSSVFLSTIYEILSHYYFLCRNKRKFTLYFKKISKLLKSTSNISSYDRSLIDIRFNIIRFYKHLFRITEGKDCKIALDYCIKAYDEAKKIENADYIFSVSYYLVNTLISSNMLLNRYTSSLEFIEYSYHLAAELKRLPEQLVFKALLAEYNFKHRVCSKGEAYKIIESCRKNSLKINRHSNWSKNIESIYFRFFHSDINTKKWLKLLRNNIKSFTLSSREYEAWWERYIYNAHKYYKKIYSLKIAENDDRKLIILNKINFNNIKNFEGVVQEGLHSYKNILSYFITALVYRDILWLEFWKGKSNNFQKANFYIRAIERMKKNKKILNLPAYPLLKTGLIISEELKYHSKNVVYKKYFSQLKALENDFKAEPRWDTYSVLYRIAEILNVNTLWKVIKDINRKIFAKNEQSNNISNIVLDGLWN